MNIEAEKKRGYIQRRKALETYDLAETIEILQSYLNDEIEVIITPNQPKKVKKKRRRWRRRKLAKPKRELTEIEILLFSIIVISSRIINKYWLGGVPRPERLEARDIMLSILRELAKAGTVEDKGIIELSKCGYKLKCACFWDEYVGEIAVPICEPEKVYENSDEEIEIKSFPQIGKKQALRNILSYYEWHKSSHFIYIVRCKDSTLYTGYTNCLEARIETHNKGKGAKYTRGRLPVELVHFEEFEDKSSAMKREAQIKKMTKINKERLLCHTL